MALQALDAFVDREPFPGRLSDRADSGDRGKVPVWTVVFGGEHRLLSIAP